MGWRVTGRALSKDELLRITDPAGRNAETFPDIKYDTQSLPAAGGVTRLTYFSALNNDLTITNMEAAGTFPAPQFFQIYGIAKEYLGAGPTNIAPAAAGTNQTGQLNDIDLIEKTQRATVTLVVSNKNYGPWPLSAFHPLGGALGFLALGVDGGAGTGRAQQYGQGGPVDGGWWLNGELVLPPTVGFSLVVNLAAAQAISVNTNLRLSLVGRLYRRAL